MSVPMERIPENFSQMNMPNGVRVLGIDCEGVIFRLFGHSLPGALESVRTLAASGDFERVYVVSRVNFLGRLFFPFRLWLLDFWGYTGVPRGHLYFCRRDKDKAVICEELGITDFIDDRLKVLHFLRTVERRYALNPHRKREFKKYPETAAEVTIIKSWDELLPLLLSTAE